MKLFIRQSSFMIHQLSLIIVHVSLLVTSYSYSQDIILPPLQDLESSLTTFIEIERDAKLRSFDQVKSTDWQDALPSLGVAYTPAGDPRPSLSWSPLQILERKEQKKRRKMDRESIYLSYEILMTDRLYRLRQLYQDYMIDLDALTLKQSTIEIDEKLYAIQVKKYEEYLIKPSEFLEAKKRILLIRADIQSVRQELMKRKNEVLYESKWDGMRSRELTTR